MRPWLLVGVLLLGACDLVAETETNEALFNPVNELSPAHRREFTGSENGDLSGDLARIEIPVSKIEADHLADRSCPETAQECDENAAFLQKIFAAYPDVRKVRFNPPSDIRDDPESMTLYRTDFYSGLFFAKQIKLANGQTLFDFLTRCSKSVDPVTSAEVSTRSTLRTDWELQFFPVLRSKANRSSTELNLLYERKGSALIARSQLFSAHALTQPTFMDDHGVECWKN